jgi:hypothetical protein
MIKKTTLKMRSTTKQKKDAFLLVYESCLGNVSNACELSNIHRTTYYLWMSDENFKKSIDSVMEKQIDFVEDALMKRIKEGDTSAIMFYLKTRGRKRGFNEKIELDVNEDKKIHITFDFGDNMSIDEPKLLNDKCNINI